MNLCKVNRFHEKTTDYGILKRIMAYKKSSEFSVKANDLNGRIEYHLKLLSNYRNPKSQT